MDELRASGFTKPGSVGSEGDSSGPLSQQARIDFTRPGFEHADLLAPNRFFHVGDCLPRTSNAFLIAAGIRSTEFSLLRTSQAPPSDS